MNIEKIIEDAFEVEDDDVVELQSLKKRRRTSAV
jgi:hypothetical protein